MARPALAVTGVFDDDTVAAVTSLQQYLGVPTTGEFDEATQSALNTVTSDPNGVNNMVAYNQQVAATSAPTADTSSASSAQTDSSSSAPEYTPPDSSSSSSNADTTTGENYTVPDAQGETVTATPGQMTVDEHGNVLPASQPAHAQPKNWPLIIGVVAVGAGALYMLTKGKGAKDKALPAGAAVAGIKDNYLDDDDGIEHTELLDDGAEDFGTEDPEMKRFEFIEYLDTTLIPDLKDSGRNATAEDFETATKLLNGKKVKGWSKKSFKAYLQSTLIPDLRESGYDSTADDFEGVVEYLDDDNGAPLKSSRKALGNIDEYKWFVVSKKTGEIMSGWEYKEDAADNKREWDESTPTKVVSKRSVAPHALEHFKKHNP
jgi:hypothetical protein